MCSPVYLHIKRRTGVEAYPVSGVFSVHHLEHRSGHTTASCECRLSAEFISSCSQERGAVLGLSSHSAEYCFLKEVAQLPFFGFEFHEVHSARGDRVQIGCGPDGLLLKNLTKDRQKRLDEMFAPPHSCCCCHGVTTDT